MAQQIIRFGVGQTAIVIGVIYALMGILAIPIFMVITSFMPSTTPSPFGGGMVLALPLLYGAMGFVTTIIGCLIYNLVASWVGGIEVELEHAD